jgi:hypothetical protein
VVVFSVGGLKLAARTEDVAVCRSWTEVFRAESDSFRAGHAEAWKSCDAGLWLGEQIE